MSIELGHIAGAIPEMFVLFMATVAILAELFLKKRCANITYVLIQSTLIGVFFLIGLQLGDDRSLAFNGLFVADDIGNILKLFIVLSTFFAFYYSRQYVEDKNIPNGEFYILGLFCVLGMMILSSAHSLLTIYLGLELMSLPLYALIALRRDCGTASEAAMKYFVMGAIASGILLYGMSMLYGATGSLDLGVINEHVKHVWQVQPMMLSFAVVFLVVGVCFKLAVVPFHMWAPDVYQGAPSAVTILISSAPKLAAAGMMFRLFVLGLPLLHSQWQPLFIMVSVASVVIGNFLAVVQTNLKRLFAYSGIAHMGYMLFGLVSATPEGYSAALYYISIYGLTAVAAFGLIILMSRLDVESEMVDDLKGLNTRSPWLAGMMLIVLFSMAGVPPMVGFFTKLMVLKALVSVGYLNIALIGLIAAVVGAFNYIRIVKTM
jgi:NADH-quinone oxidoreductase subunit N